MSIDCTPDGCEPFTPGRSIAPPTWDPHTARNTRTALAAYASADASSARFGPHYFNSEADLSAFVAEQVAANSRQTIYRWDLNRSTGEWVARPIIEPGRPAVPAPDLEPLDLEPTDPADQLALLRVVAARKGVVIKRHDPKTGTYYTMRDAASGARIGRYPDLLAVDDALINRVDEPAVTDR